MSDELVITQEHIDAATAAQAIKPFSICDCCPVYQALHPKDMITTLD